MVKITFQNILHTIRTHLIHGLMTHLVPETLALAETLLQRKQMLIFTLMLWTKSNGPITAQVWLKPIQLIHMNMCHVSCMDVLGLPKNLACGQGWIELPQPRNQALLRLQVHANEPFQM